MCFAHDVRHLGWRVFFCLLVFGSLTSCAGKAVQKFEEKEKEVSSSFIEEVRRQEKFGVVSSTTRRLDWEAAVALMYERNIACLRAKERVAEAKLRQNRLWREMIPGLTVRVSDSSTISELGSAFADPSIRINSFLALGNLIRMPRESYQQQFLVIGAELSAQEAQRQQTIALYRLFREGEFLEAEAKAIEISEQLSLLRKGESLRSEDDSFELMQPWHQRRDAWQEKVANFFSLNPGAVTLIASGLPLIDYTDKDLDFTDTARWGKLQLKMLALEELAAEGRIALTYLRYLPRASVGVSVPTLYSNRRSDSFDPSLSRISPSLSWRLDTRSDISRQLKRLKKEGVYKSWQNDRRRREEIQRALEGKEALRVVRAEFERAQKLKSEYEILLKKDLIPARATDPFDTMVNFVKTEFALRAKEEDILTSFWFIDDERWANVSSLGRKN